MAQDSYVEELSASLVREYLSRKGLKGTLTKLDEELPRTEESISNRASLAKAVHIERLMKKNKDETTPHRTMIEVIVKFLKSSEARKSSHTATPTKTATTTAASIEGGGADSAHQANSGRGIAMETELLIRGTGHFISERDKGHLQQQNVHSLSSKYQDGKPITKPPTSNPPAYKFSSFPPHQSDSWSDDSTNKGTKVDRKTHSTPLSQKGGTKVVTVAPRAGRADDMISAGLAESSSRRTRSSKGEGRLPGQRISTFTKDGSNLKQSRTGDVTISGDDGAGNWKETPARPSVQEPPRVATATGPEITSQLGKQKVIKVPSSSPTDELLLFEDLEDLDISDSLSSSRAPVTHALKSSTSTIGTPIDLATAKCLRELVFGTATGPSFNAEWRRQNFVFCDLPKLEYGLIQHKGGPCGVLACVQAYILKHLIFTGSEKRLTSSLQPTQGQRNSSLVAALTEILWKAGQQNSATVALRRSAHVATNKRGILSTSHYKTDGITETLILHKFTNSHELSDFINRQLPMLQDGSSSGCILFLYSLLLSKGVENVKKDMDVPTTLLGAHGYCTQELVNLMLTGYAVSNVFNGTQELDSGGKEKTVLRGPPQRSEVGLLSLFEHYDVCSVGTHLKEPVYPIWVVSCESHFTVLFCHKQSTTENQLLGNKFDLHYYDGLANQDRPIVLTIEVGEQSYKSLVPSSPGHSQFLNDDLEPPLELVIKTKWQKAKIDWNGTEPLL